MYDVLKIWLIFYPLIFPCSIQRLSGRVQCAAKSEARALVSVNIMVSRVPHDYFTAVCDTYNVTVGETESEWTLWSDNTVPIYLVLLLFPLCCLKSATVLSKFNSLGILLSPL